ncbi:hypothetical protein SAY87_024979 [Trapa incisa]|uniref:RING-type E3 ubiquitin transferase n=1 Tax=Trapa incisa TaxID=236973 RepID=A0AAN7GDR6_9MYRT|nr:hypothetical protein SAY87_024979 [Trapa incisa]
MASEASDQTTFSSLFMPFLLGFAAMQQEQESGSRVVLINPLVVQSMAVIGVGHGPSAKDGPPPASETAIEALRAVEADEERSECTICLEGWEAGKEMPCGHRFHGDCIERWLRIHGSCPVCRFKLPAADHEEEKKREEPRGGVEGRVWITFSFNFGEGRGSGSDTPADGA